MGCYIAADGGGSKFIALLFDDKLILRGAARSGGVYTTAAPDEVVERNIMDCFRSLNLHEGEDTHCVYGSFPNDNPAFERVMNELGIKRMELIDEGRLGLYAAMVIGGGFLALAGTGATMFFVDGDKTVISGGFGSVVYDEGSGYFIGRMALKAVITDYEGYGQTTVLTRYVCEAFGYDDARDAIVSLYARNRPPIAEVAALAPLVSQAARNGDRPALSILRDAGKSLAIQISALIA